MATKTTMTAAEARELADRLDAEERERVRAEREARRCARLAEAQRILAEDIDVRMVNARNDADKALADAIAANPPDLATVANAYQARSIAYRVHREALNVIIPEIWESSGRPMRHDTVGSPQPAYIRPILRHEDPPAPGHGIAAALDGVAHYAAVRAAVHAKAQIQATLQAAESSAAAK
jgi:hypothetical protein